MARVPASGGPIEFEAIYPRIGALSRDGRRLAYLETTPNCCDYSMVWRCNFPVPAERSYHKPESLLPPPPEKTPHNSRPMKPNWSFIPSVRAPTRYGKAMPTAAKHCS